MLGCLGHSLAQGKCISNGVWCKHNLVVEQPNCAQRSKLCLNRDTNYALLTSQDTGKVRTFVKIEGRLTKCTVCAPSCQCYFYPGLLEHVKNSSFQEEKTKLREHLEAYLCLTSISIHFCLFPPNFLSLNCKVPPITVRPEYQQLKDAIKVPCRDLPLTSVGAKGAIKPSFEFTRGL